MRTMAFLAAGLMALAALASAFVLARSVTTAADDPPSMEEGCRVAPRPAASLETTPGPRDTQSLKQLEATPIPASAFPTGQAADAATVAGVNATLREIVACLRAGDRARVLSLFAADIPPARLYVLGIYDVYAFPSWTPAADDAGLTVPVPTSVRLLDDGRAAAIFEVDSDAQGGPALVVYFVEDNGRWLIAELERVDLSTAQSATPVQDAASPSITRGDGFQGVIDSAARADAFLVAFSGEYARGYRSPARADIVASEVALVSFVRNGATPRSVEVMGLVALDLWQRLADHRRQYIGVIE
jgi:hypothetical protein